jgi:hypothetical protein
MKKSVYAILAIISLSISLVILLLGLAKNEIWANNSFNIPILVSVLWGVLQTS